MEYEGTAKKGFTFIWRIENLWISLDRAIHSPKFFVEALDKSEWHLELEPGFHYADEHLACRLRRDDDNAPESIDVEFEMSLISDRKRQTENGQSSKFSFKKGECFSCDELALRLDVFQTTHVTFTVHCRMWATGTGFTEDDQCSARTKIAKKTNLEFTWITEHITSLSTGPSKSVSLASTPDEIGTSMTLKMFLKNGTYRVKGFNADVKGIESERVVLLSFIISIMDSEGNVVRSESHNYPIKKDVSNYEWHVPFYITKEELKAYSPRDVLILLWKCKSVVINVNKIEFGPRGSFGTRKLFNPTDQN